MKSLLLIFLMTVSACCCIASKVRCTGPDDYKLTPDTFSISSPDKKIKVLLRLKNRLSYSIQYLDEIILQPSYIDLVLGDGKNLSGDLRIQQIKIQSFDEKIISPVPEKRIHITDKYNQLTVEFLQPYTLLIRVYNDGVAYRIITGFKDSITVKNEVAQFTFTPGKKILLPIVEPRKDMDRFHTSFEELYQLKMIDSLTSSTIAYTPVLTGTENEIKIAITESDLQDYPGMFLTGTGKNMVEGVFASYPAEIKMSTGEFPQAIVNKREGFIARIKGNSMLPWRVLMIATQDKDLPGNDIVYRLGRVSTIKDVSWIHPGKATDEWIIGINLFNVPFKSGINTATYKYYIDFVRKFGLQRIMMDAGWSNYQNLFDINPALNMDSLAAYAKVNHVKISMWTLCSTLDKQLEAALDQFNKWGVDFIMTDFMDRDDQLMVNFYHRIAKACAAHKIMIMFHGAFPPKGFNRTWPNAITREGLLGSEYNIWSDKASPEHDVTLPFTRMLGGSMDYEPGILDNATKAQFRPIQQKVMSQGTRCHQLAMFVVYDSPMQIFSGNPSQGLQEPEFMKFLGNIPTTWDETEILEARVSDYIITARKKGNDWYIGGMTDWTPRDFALKLDFLDNGLYDAQLCGDGMNAETFPSDYLLKNFTVRRGLPVIIKLAPGGGFVLKLSKQH
ncbi:MAG: glycoside hydrolase family 97 protein [Ginsengibacter sp.]